MATILVADSWDLGRSYVREVLQFDGHEVLEAEDYSRLVSLLLSSAVDVVLIDPGLRGGHSGALQRLLRGRSEQVPRVYLLGDGCQDRLAHQAQALGADGAFVRGEDAVGLLRAVEAAARSAAAGGEDVVLVPEATAGVAAPPEPQSEPPGPRRPWDSSWSQ